MRHGQSRHYRKNALIGGGVVTYALAPTQADPVSLRETFFLNQLQAQQWDRPFPPAVTYPETGDFLVDAFERTYLFEIGGKNKTMEQIRAIDNAYLAVDDLEIGFERKIPLWLFGFLY